ncbi:hypothetical protein D5086_005573 [Populus alba]|uniref:Uncharacterized protein n=1 Tax=Populus alba TaxID=43335 RepID=A0ACC4CTK4_POPAL
MGGVLARRNGGDASFYQNYDITWGYDHVKSLDGGRQIQLSLDNASGAGFGSKLSFGSGFINMRIKLPGKDSAGVVTAFYVNHREPNAPPCYSTSYWWNTRKYRTLDAAQQRAYENVRKKYLTYDYCSDRVRHPTPPPECPQ